MGRSEMIAASGVPLPSLRVLQSASDPLAEGAGIPWRLPPWTENDILKAAIAAALGKHFAWNIRVVASVMATVSGRSGTP